MQYNQMWVGAGVSVVVEGIVDGDIAPPEESSLDEASQPAKKITQKERTRPT